MATYLRSITDIRDFIRGCTLFGVGGGGNPLLGIARMEEILKKNGIIELIDPKDISDEEMTCCVFGMGSIAPNENVSGAYAQLSRVTKDPNIRALQELEKLAGCKISAVVAFEPGGVNTSIGLHAGAMLGRKIVDGDYSGRAVPELCQTGPVMYGKKVTPVAICDDWGNIIHIKDTASNAALEGIGKQISIVTKAPDKFAICAHAGMLLSGSEMKKYIIPNTLTKALEVGRTIREANEKGKDAVDAATEYICGKVLFKGIVSSKDYISTGYMIGDTVIKGYEEFEGSEMRVWYKNENHIAWKDGKVIATSPDIIEIVQLKDAEPITNSNLSVGNEVAVIGAPHLAYRTPEALSLMGPKYFGFDIDYMEIERLW